MLICIYAHVDFDIANNLNGMPIELLYNDSMGIPMLIVLRIGSIPLSQTMIIVRF